MLSSFSSPVVLLIVSAVLALLLPLPMVLGFGLLVVLGFAIDVASLWRQTAPALHAVHKG